MVLIGMTMYYRNNSIIKGGNNEINIMNFKYSFLIFILFYIFT